MLRVPRIVPSTLKATPASEPSRPSDTSSPPPLLEVATLVPLEATTRWLPLKAAALQPVVPTALVLSRVATTTLLAWKSKTTPAIPPRASASPASSLMKHRKGDG